MYQPFRFPHVSADARTHARTHAGTHARTHARVHLQCTNPASDLRVNFTRRAKVNETPEHQAPYLSVLVDENKRVGHISVS